MKYWTTKITRNYSAKQRWAKLRVLSNDNDGDYFDILIGHKNKEPHAHFGITLDQKLLFEEYRGLVGEMSRKVESQNLGLLDWTTEKIDPAVKAASKFVFQVKINKTTGRVTVSKFALSEEVDPAN